MEGFKHKDIHTLRLDVTSDDDVQEVVKTIIENEGRIDVLVNNAGSNCAGETCFACLSYYIDAFYAIVQVL